MANQRLILFLIFSFSLVMLWDAWHKQGTAGKLANPPAVTAAAPAASVTGSAAAPVPIPSASTIPGAGTPVPQTYAATKLAVTTDLYNAEISAQGGDLVRLELRQHRGTEDKKADFVLFETKHSYAAQGGLIGAGLPTHKTVWQLPDGKLEMKDGEQELKLRLTAPAADGVLVAKTYTFKRGSYLVDVEYEIANGSAAAIAPHAYSS
jgi:YidC/Oxa1 family membrane protein insertase